MGLTLVTGDRNAGKTGEVHRRAREAAAAGLSVAVLVPSMPERDRAADEFARDCPTRIAVQTLDGFVRELWEQWGDGRRIVGEPERLILLDEAIGRSRAEWEGLVPESALRRVLAPLVQRAAERSPTTRLQTPADPLAAALVAAVRAYERLLEERRLIEQQAACMLTAATCASQRLPHLICVNRFETFTPPQAAFLEAASRATDVVLALTHVPGSAVTAAVDPLAERFTSSAERVVRVSGGPVATDPEIASLQEGLSAGEKRAVARGAVTVVGVRGSSQEAEAAARAIAEMAESGISPDQICLVARRIDRRATELGDALDAYGLPWRYEGTWRFRDSGFGRSALALLRLVSDGRREDLATFVQGGYAGLTAEEADEFLKDVRRRRPAHGDELWRQAMRAPGAAGRILSAAATLRRDGRGLQAAEAVREIADMMLANRHGPSPVLDRAGRLDARCRQRMLEAVAAVVEFRGAVEPDVLVSVLEQARVTVEDDVTGVVVSSPERIRSRRFDALVVVGLQADEFPSIGDALGLPRKTAEALQAAGIDVRPRRDLDAERLLFYQTVTAARRRLVLVWQDQDEDGRDRERSLFVDELLDAYEHAPTVRQGAAADGGAAGAVGSVERPRGARAEISVRQRSEWEDAELGPDVREALSRRTAFSAGELETYARCPRSWFYRHLMRAEGLDAEVDARSKGRIAHAIMQRFYERWQELGAARLCVADLPRARDLHAYVARAVLADAMDAESLNERAQIQRAVRGSWAVIARDAESFEGFEPLRHEVVLSEQAPWCDFGDWRLKGRVDRIDAGERGLIVADYKSSTKSGLSWQKFAEEGVLQAPLYAAAVSRMLGLPVVGMLYRAMSWRENDRGAYLRDVVRSPWLVREDSVSADEIEAIIADAVTRAGQAVAGIRAGLIPCEPVGKDACTYCPARTWCGKAAR